jgi:hypothetical protein
MLHYPQLTSGSICQFPVKRRTTLRTVSNDLPSGDNIRMSDRGAARVRWQLQYVGLTDGERSSLEQLFESAEGRLTTFTLLDPTDNLLMWSEDYTKSVWTVDPLLQVTAGIADPFGGTGATQLTNTAQVAQSATQSIPAASWFQYCFSVYVRCDTPSTIELVFSAAGQELRSAIAVGVVWTRAAKTGSIPSTQDLISFRLELPAGARVSTFGAQVEPQLAPGHYKKSLDRAGVYSSTRFDSDSLAITTEAPNQHSCSVSLVSGL